MYGSLSPFQEALILSVFAKGAYIHEARYFQATYLPAPLRVEVVAPDGTLHRVVLRLSRRPPD
jgi:hypothetical protein